MRLTLIHLVFGCDEFQNKDPVCVKTSDAFPCDWAKCFLLAFILTVAWEMEGHLNSKKTSSGRHGETSAKSWDDREERWNILLKRRRTKGQGPRISDTKGCEPVPQMKWEVLVAPPHQQCVLCEVLCWVLANTAFQFQSLHRLISTISMKTSFEFHHSKSRWAQQDRDHVSRDDAVVWNI